MMSDIDLAREFIYDQDIDLGDDNIIRMEGGVVFKSTISGNVTSWRDSEADILSRYAIVGVLYCWLLEQLRDGGKNDLWIRDLPDNAVEVQIRPTSDFEGAIGAVRTSDLGALIKAYKLLKEKA